MFGRFLLAVALLAAGCGGAQAQGVLGGYLGSTIASRARPAAPAPESPSAAYARLCAPGGAALSANTCQAMKRDIDGAAKPETEATKAYRELCAPSAPKLSRETCAAMRGDLNPTSAEITTISVPGGIGWAGLSPGRADGVAGAYVYSVWPGGPAAQAGIRTGDRVITVDSKRVNDDTSVRAAFQGSEIGRRIKLKILRGGAVRDVQVVLGVPPVLKPTLNASRAYRKPASLWSGAAPTVDTVRVGEIVHGVLERSDGDTISGWGWRADCLEIAGSQEAKNLRVRVGSTGSKLWVMVQQDNCGDGFPSSPGTFVTGSDDSEFNLATTAGHSTFLYLTGKPATKPYEIYIREQTASETVAWHQTLRQVAVMQEQRRADEARAAENRSDMWGNVLQGALIVGQGYAAGMQEANDANARSQAIIDAAAESDRQYRAAQRATELARQAVPQSNSSPPPQRAQASTRPAAPPAVRAAPTAPATPQRPAAPPSNASGGGLQPRTVQAYFSWGMALGPNNTRNPRCFSNIFSITYMSDPNGWGDAGRAEAEAGRLASVFRQKCERLGRMDPGTPPAQIGLPGVPFSAPYVTAEDYRVILP